MQNPPIFYTVGQIKFNPVLDMQEFVSRIQRDWRSTCPDFSQDTVNEIQIHLPGPDKAPEVKTISSPRWNFKDAKRSSGFLLGTDSLAFHTTAYKDRDHFISALLSGLDVVNSHVGLAYIESVGVRTLDAVVPQAGEHLSDYLQPGILGIYGRIEGQLKQSLLQLALDTKSGQVISRVVLLNGTIGIPAELAPISLNLEDRVSAINGLHVVLDNDCVMKERASVDLSDLDKRLREVKSQVSTAFHETVSPHAIKTWS